jgi:hypothetical protein
MATGRRNDGRDTFVSKKPQWIYLVSEPKFEHETSTYETGVTSINQVVRTWKIQQNFNYSAPAYLAGSINRRSGEPHIWKVHEAG